jgi:protein-disulfide isomerase
VSNERQQRAARAEQMRKEREKADKKQRNLITVGIVVVVVALIALAGFAVASTSNDKKDVTDVIQPAGATKDFGIVYTPEDAGAKVKDGAKPVSVELYEDFQCPACLSFEQQSGAFLHQQVESGAISITYRPFSFLDENGGSTNEYSHRSTNVALCVLDKGGVKDYVKAHDYLYANQPDEGTDGPTDKELVAAMKSNDITSADIQSCVDTSRFVPWIDAAKEAGSDKGVSSTPTVKVAGKKLESPTPQALQAAIDKAAKA